MEDKIFFQPGDVLTIRQDIPNKPIMIVVKKVNSMNIDTTMVVKSTIPAQNVVDLIRYGFPSLFLTKKSCSLA